MYLIFVKVINLISKCGRYLFRYLLYICWYLIVVVIRKNWGGGIKKEKLRRGLESLEYFVKVGRDLEGGGGVGGREERMERRRERDWYRKI